MRLSGSAELAANRNKPTGGGPGRRSRREKRGGGRRAKKNLTAAGSREEPLGARGLPARTWPKPSGTINAIARSTRQLFTQSLTVAAAQALLASAVRGGSGSDRSLLFEEFGDNSAGKNRSEQEASSGELLAGSGGFEKLGGAQEREAPPGRDNFLIPGGNPRKQEDKLGSSNNEQSFSDWWSEYWSGEPFPSGYTTSSITILACFITTIIFLIVVGNVLVCIAIFTEKSLKPTQNWFIASLAVSDMLLGLVVMPFSLARELMGFWMFGPLWCDIHEAMDVLLTTASINTLCLISLDRYWSITQAVKYLKKRTPRRGALMIAFVWILSAAVSLPPLFGWKKPSDTLKVTLNKTLAIQEERRQQEQQQLEAALGNFSANFRPEQTNQQEPRPRAELPDKRARLAAGGSANNLNRRPQLAVPYGQFQQPRSPLSYLPNDPSQGDKVIDEDMPLAELPPEQAAPNDSMRSPLGALLSADSQRVKYENIYQTGPNTAEYPLCELSDDIGYVLYSALGSFFIPCAVMVFTYVKIFKAARSRARRAISKHQTRSSNQTAASKSRWANRQQSGKPVEPKLELDTASEPAQPAAIEPTMTTKGKLVIVERKKSLAASAAPQTSRPTPPELPPEAPKQADGGSSASMRRRKSPGSLEQKDKHVRDDKAPEEPLAGDRSVGEQPPELAGANESADRRQERASVEAQEESRRAAALLKTISQVGALADRHQWLLSTSEEESAERDLEAGPKEPPEPPGEPACELAAEPAPVNATNETCFMTIEEDSDAFDGQTGRTVMLIAGNASKKHSLSSGQLGRQSIMMTMLPASSAARPLQEALVEEHQSPVSCNAGTGGVCNSATCRAAAGRNNRSVSSYCGGSSMTINDELDDDECPDELDTDDCNGYSVSCALDQYCSGTGNSCSHCQECERAQDEHLAGSGARAFTRHLSIADSPMRSSHAAKFSAKRRTSDTQHSTTYDENMSLTECRSNGEEEDDDEEEEDEEEEDDEEEEEEASSVVGHDVLDATSPQHKRSSSAATAVSPAAAEKKKSLANITSSLISSYAARNEAGQASKAFDSSAKRKSIGFRLTRLGSSAPQPAAQGTTNLMALANGSNQQVAGRNLRSVKQALRQNFFLKLNQLTIKSAAKQAAETKRPKSSSSPTGKSSAPSSGTSYEQSVDCATTSNLHSEYQHETTAYTGDIEDSEQQTSGEQTATSLNMKLNSTSTQEKDSSGGGERPFRSEQRPANSTGAKSQPQSLRDNDNRRPLSLDKSLAGRNEQLLQAGSAGKDDDNKQQQQQQQPRPLPKRNPQGSAQEHSVALIESTGTGRANNQANCTKQAGQAPPSSKAYLASDNERHKRKLAKARERRAILILGIIMAAFICAWLPFFTFYVIRAVCKRCRDYVPPRIGAFIFWAGYCNSAINPIIYTIFNRDFRKAFRKLLLCKR